ncbi:LysR family transcriptional regulator [Bordetella petrii]|uniref:LysR family transcriptional regulator n=1 Tax=Bordetella petrii TaxID=94624 RepID=A0ABT7W4M3_9BORD|nr:LysR family transcriptional regulator [Bordetella petrii]MDM9560146.1 LysR family transcriptional regulator [Bordetella petrii]
MNKDVDRLRDMALFAEIAKAGTFTKAAEILGMPTSTLSRRISDFEDSIGVRLLHRTTRRITLTEVGARYLQQIDEIIQQAHAINEELDSEMSSPAGPLRVSMPADFGAYFADAHFREFHATYPDIRFEFFMTSVLPDLMVEPYDASILLGDPPAESRLIARRVGTVRQNLYASPAYLERHPAPTTPSQLADHQCLLMPGADPDEGWMLLNGAETARIQPRPLLSANSQPVLKQLVVEGVGIGQLSRTFAAALADAGKIVRVLPDWELQPRALYVLTATRLLPARVRVFVEFLLEKIRPLD